MQPNKIIQNYQVTHLLGSGGMGEVWAGHHLYMDRKVAIKALHPSLANNAEIRGRFKNEAVTMSQLDHPNIVRLYDYIEESDGVYLVMEFVDGDPLDLYIQNKTGPIPEAHTRHLFAQMLAGLHYAHKMGVIHRDIKPSNFMITPAHQVKILDFGIAKLLQQVGAQRTKTGTRIGTVYYMSPEQVKGQELDARSDIYALGVTLFQMLTGQCPYAKDATEYDVYQRIVQDPLPRAAQFYPAVSAEMQALIDRATAKLAKDRFQSCELFQQALLGQQPAQANIPAQSPARQAAATVVESQVAAPQSAARPKRRLHWSLKLLLWLFLLGGASFAGYRWGWPALMKALGPNSGLNFMERGPKVVALEFLEAVETRDSLAAVNLADQRCQGYVSYLMFFQPEPNPRRVEILKEKTNGIQSDVSYRYAGDRKVHSIHLQRRRGIWEVECDKTDLQ